MKSQNKTAKNKGNEMRGKGFKLLDPVYKQPNKKISQMRRTGETTRKIDRFVQDLFTKGITYVYDIRGHDAEKDLAIRALNILKRRLQSEHHIKKLECIWGNWDGINCFRVTIIS